MIVDLTPTDDQRLIMESAGGFFARALPVARLRQPGSFGAAAERAVWPELVALGLFGLGLPEAEGGVGYGLPEEVLAARAMGRHCVSPAVLATMLAVHAAAARDRPALAEGRARAAFANPLGGGDAQIIDGAEAAWLLVPDTGALIAAPEPDARRAVRAIDETVAMERARIAPGSPDAALAGRISLLAAAYLVGIAQATLDLAVAYAGTREQFGQPIGAFQAIKHACADMAVRAAGAEAQCFYAAVTQSGRDIACARLLAREAALSNAKANIQVHGGMGFTAECDAHLYLKRALLIAALGSSLRGEQMRILAA